jgi:hypothetical protein
MDYCADTDTLEPLTPENASFFMHLIGVMRWMVEIGRIDIATEVSILSSYLHFLVKDTLRLPSILRDTYSRSITLTCV